MRNKRKISFTIIIAAVVIVIVALLFIFRDSLFGNIGRFDTTTFNSDIVIKRSDAQEPLSMPYRYSKVLMDNRLVYNEEIVGINISSVKYGISDTGLSLYNYKDVLKNGDSKEAKAVVDSIKYCKGVTTLSGIISDKEKSKITIYEGYTADLMIESLHHYVIIPSALSDYINEELPENEKVLFIMNPETNGLAYFTIIGEYETKNESDALYLSYCGLSTLVLGGRKDISDHIDCMEIDVNEHADLTVFSYFLIKYFADFNVLSHYDKRINSFNEPYSYMFVNTVDIKAIDLTEEEGFEKNIIRISRIDGKDKLEMSHVYADALVNDYYKYSQYITDLNISTGRKGVDLYNRSAFSDIPSYDFTIELGGDLGSEFVYCMKEQGEKWPCFHQAVTSITEIERMKKGCEITFYTDYTNKDLKEIRRDDFKEGGLHMEGGIKGYAIIPATIHEATCNHRSIDYHVVYMVERGKAIDPLDALRVGFKVIGYYELSEGTKEQVTDNKKVREYDKDGNEDEYDTIFITYTGHNDKYIKQSVKNEHIEAITIETRSDVEITELIKYLKKYFAPSDETAGYIGSKNELGLEYEYCFTVMNSIQ